MSQHAAQRTIGILGAGQLGLMLSQSLADLGARVLMLDPQRESPAALRTAFTHTASFEDEQALTKLFSACDKVTYEFEHIPTKTLRKVLDTLGCHDKLWPSLTVLEHSQNRIAEKNALAAAQAPLTAWVEVSDATQLDTLRYDWLQHGRCGILKTANGGYDGKGQWHLQNSQDWQYAIESLKKAPERFPLVLEEKCDLLSELSVIVGRHPTLGTVSFPTVENKHVSGILDTTFYPPRIPQDVCEEARRIAEHIAQQWDVFGLLTVEFFAVRTEQKIKLLVNEVAPRPHNSGHVTRCSLTRSQFDVLAQILLDLPFHILPVSPQDTWAMWNTLGDLWKTPTAWWPNEILAHGAVCEAMLYGKPDVRPGRKMGHIILRGRDHAALEEDIEYFRSTFHSTQGGLR